MKTLKDVEKEHIKYALDQLNGKITETALKLGISRAGLYRKIALYGIVVVKKLSVKE